MNAERLQSLFLRRVQPFPSESECWPWPEHERDRGGYGVLRYREGGRIRRVLAHRLSYLLHNGPLTPGLEVMHECDVRCCVNPRHLKLGTHLENEQDKVDKGRQAKGGTLSEDLTDELAQELLDRYRAGEAVASLAWEYDLAPKVVQDVCYRRKWKHLT